MGPTIGGRPRIALALPGRWMQVPVGDRAREEALLEELRRTAPDGEARSRAARVRLDQLARSGGDQLLVRHDRLTLVTVAWPRVLPPPGIFAGGQVAVESLRAEAGGDAVPVRSQHGYPLVRAEHGDEDVASWSYWMAHPVSARILVIGVTDHVRGWDSVRVYDAVAGAVRWDDADPLAGGG